MTQVNKYSHHINDPEFAEALVASFLDICPKTYTQPRSETASTREPDVPPKRERIPYSPKSFPNAKPGFVFSFPYLIRSKKSLLKSYDWGPETLERTQGILGRLRDQIEKGVAIIGGGAGTGISAKFEEAGGIDLIVIYNSGRFRMAGRGSLAGLLPFADANAVVLEMANEVLPVKCFFLLNEQSISFHLLTHGSLSR